MKQYKYLEHTADVEFVAFGKDLESLVVHRNAVVASGDLIGQVAKNGVVLE